MSKKNLSASKIFFVTGTDTNAGKTFASCRILSAAKALGMSTAAIKPVAAGVCHSSQGMQNDDVIAVATSTSKLVNI